MNVFICTARIDLRGEITQQKSLVAANTAEEARGLCVDNLGLQPPAFLAGKTGPLAVKVPKLSYDADKPTFIRKF